MLKYWRGCGGHKVEQIAPHFDLLGGNSPPETCVQPEDIQTHVRVVFSAQAFIPFSGKARRRNKMLPSKICMLPKPQQGEWTLNKEKQ
jgi:hypothetical protein